MVLISKNDKKIWEEYVSNFSKFVVFPQNNENSHYSNIYLGCKTQVCLCPGEYHKLNKVLVLYRENYIFYVIELDN